MQFSVGLKIYCYGWKVGGGRDQNMLQMLTGGPKYMQIRKAIFGKVHGRRVKEI